MTRGFSWFVGTFRLLIVAVWIAGAAAATMWLPSLGETESSDLGELVAQDSEAVRARARSAELFTVPLLSEIAVVQRAEEGLSPDARQRVYARAVSAAQNEAEPAFALPLTNEETFFPAAREHGTTAVTYLFFDPALGLKGSVDGANAWVEENITAPDDHLVGVSGAAPARLVQAHEIEDSLPLVELATMAFIGLLVAVTFRSVAAPFVILLSAALAYVVTVRVLPAAGHLLGVEIPREIEPLVVVLLLGLVTDYAIFFLTGFRSRLRSGQQRVVAAKATTARNLGIVVTAGLIVAAGAMTLFAGELDYLRALGPGLALTAVLGLLAAITLVPALLAILGRAAFWPGRNADGSSAAFDEEVVAPATEGPRRGSLRERVAFVATAKPLSGLLALLAGAALVAAGSGLTHLDLGFTLIRGLPTGSEPRIAEAAAAQGFTAGILAPTELLVEGRGVGTDRAALIRLETLLRREGGVAGVVGPGDAPTEIPAGVLTSENGDAARFIVVFDEEPLGASAIDTLQSLDDALPGLLARAGLENVQASLTGDTAIARDTISQIVKDLERIALAALCVNLVFLALFLRSLVAPLLLLCSSVLGLAATLGLTTYVFQVWLGYDELTYFVPFAAAVLLVSLGSDYNVFVVGRMWEEVRRRPMREAIARAAPRASGTISVAGIALAGSFALLALIPIRSFRELAFALAVGVLVDAFLVRSVLVPSLVSLFGRVSLWPGKPADAEAHRP